MLPVARGLKKCVRRVARYQLQDQIAAGGMGEVWRAIDPVLDRPVAVKLLRAEHARRAETVARFRGEARHAGSLSHPAITAARTSMAASSAVVGTPGYLAPERVAGATAAPASDLYSLGVVAYECLAGRPPFTGTPQEVARAHRDRMLPPLPGTVPADVASLIADLTAKNPAVRPGSAGEVATRAARLRDDLAGGTAEVMTAGAPGTASRTLAEIPLPGALAGHPRTRHAFLPGRLGVLPAALVAALILAGSAGLLAGVMVRTPRDHRRPCFPTRRSG